MSSYMSTVSASLQHTTPCDHHHNPSQSQPEPRTTNYPRTTVLSDSASTELSLRTRDTTMESFLRTHKVEDRPASRGIEDPPNELLLEIQDDLIESGKDVREPSRTRDLWSLSLTSKRFHAIANPELYRVYDHKGVNHLRRFLSTSLTRQ